MIDYVRPEDDLSSASKGQGAGITAERPRGDVYSEEMTSRLERILTSLQLSARKVSWKEDSFAIITAEWKGGKGVSSLFSSLFPRT